MTTNSIFEGYQAPELAEIKINLCEGFAVSNDNKNGKIDIIYGGTDDEFGW